MLHEVSDGYPHLAIGQRSALIPHRDSQYFVGLAQRQLSALDSNFPWHTPRHVVFCWRYLSKK